MATVSNKLNQNGVIHLPLVAVIILVGAVAFTAGVAYRVQNSRANIEIVSTDEPDIREIKEVDIEEIIAVLPEERKQEKEDLKEETDEKIESDENLSTQKPQQKPAEPKQQPKEKPADKTNIIKISNITITKSGATYTLTATLPQKYSGTCQGLLKPESGGEQKDHINVSKSFSGSTCSVQVDEAQLSGFDEWRTYMSFYSSDKTVKSHWNQSDSIRL